MQVAAAVGVVVDQLQQQAQTFLHGLIDRVVGFQQGFLGHVSDAQPLLNMQLPIVCPFQAR